MDCSLRQWKNGPLACGYIGLWPSSRRRWPKMAFGFAGTQAFGSRVDRDFGLWITGFGSIVSEPSTIKSPQTSLWPADRPAFVLRIAIFNGDVNRPFAPEIWFNCFNSFRASEKSEFLCFLRKNLYTRKKNPKPNLHKNSSDQYNKYCLCDFQLNLFSILGASWKNFFFRCVLFLDKQKYPKERVHKILSDQHGCFVWISVQSI